MTRSAGGGPAAIGPTSGFSMATRPLPLARRSIGTGLQYTPDVDFGVGYFPTHDGIGPGAGPAASRSAGQESLFFAEHTHIPASRETPYPGGGELPPQVLAHATTCSSR